MGSTPPSKDTSCQNGLKMKIQQSVAYRRPISLTEISTSLGWKAGRIFTKTMAPEKGRGSSTYLRQSRLKLTLIKRDKEGHSILIKGEIHQKEITIINLYAPNVTAPNFIKHTLKDWKASMNYNTVIVGDSNTLLSPIDMSSKQKNQ
jgi:hypothetical protein